MHKSSISSVEIATGMFMLLFNSLFLPMFCYLPFILRYFMCVYFMSFHFPFHARYFHVLSIICSYPFIVPACHVQILTDRIFGMHDLGHHGGHNLYVWILGKKKTNIHSYKSIFFRRSHSFHAFHSPVSFLSVSFHFLPCSFYFRQSYLCFTFTLFNFPPFLFLSCPSDVPLVSLSVRLIFLLIFLLMFLLIFLSCPFHFTLLSLQFPSLFSFKSFHFSCMSCHFSKSYRISVHICFKLCSWSLVLFMIFLARLCIGVPNSLCDNVQQF